MATLCVEPTVRLRDADAAECGAGGMTPYEAIVQSIHQSTVAQQYEIDGEIAAYWGWRRISALGSVAQVWMLSTEIVNARPITFARQAQREFDFLLTTYTTLVVHVYSYHHLAIKWLNRLGFIEVMRVGDFIEMRAYREGHNPWARS